MSKRERADARETDKSIYELVPDGAYAVTKTEPIASPPVAKPEPRRPSRGCLLVATNPFCASDHQGRPSGACPMDPKFQRGEFVGATRIDHGVTRPGPKRVAPGSGFYQQTERRDIEWQFQREPLEVQDSPYYRKKIAEGVLFDGTKDYEAARRSAQARSNCTSDPRWV